MNARLIAQDALTELNRRYKEGIFTTRAKGIDEGARIVYDLAEMNALNDNDTNKLLTETFKEVRKLIPENVSLT